uniref:C-type lectin domain-containing protein n=1 Tax=Anabas testudineus TaxID=64144 RepID=A0A7N6AIS1_ANATE
RDEYHFCSSGLDFTITSITVVFPLFLGQSFFCTCHLYVYHFIGENKTWDERYCRVNHTDLVSGLDQLDDDSVKNESDVWIGVFRDTWRWSDGRNFSFRNWEYVEDLVDGQTGKWSSFCFVSI